VHFLTVRRNLEPWRVVLQIKHIERPKGCLRALRLLSEQGEITVRDLMKKASLSQSGAYSSMNHLAGLDLIECSVKGCRPGRCKAYRPTEKGEELLVPLSVFFDSLPLVTRRENIDRYLVNSYRTLEILLEAYRRGCVTMTNLVKEAGMCKSTACSGLRTLLDLDLLEMEVRTEFRKTTKEYSLTPEGQFLGKIVQLVDEKMGALVRSN
jgi:predicted transcriptional regulator